jgi:hypothetical protein
MGGLLATPERPHGAASKQGKETIMTHTPGGTAFDSLDIQEWDECDIRDLVRTTPLLFDQDGTPDSYETEQLFGLEGSLFGSRFR